MRQWIGLIASLALAASTQAQTWTEVGDAPARIAPNGNPSPPDQPTLGVGALTTINGTGQIDAAGRIDPDVYCVSVPGQPGTTVPVSLNTLLTSPPWDTMIALYDITGTTQILFNDDNPFPLSNVSGSVAPGLYKVAITRFADFDFDDTGVGGTSPYTITLSGFGYCDIPEPASLSLLALGGLLLVRRR
jgi:hypothetical protein